MLTLRSKSLSLLSSSSSNGSSSSIRNISSIVGILSNHADRLDLGSRSIYRKPNEVVPPSYFGRMAHRTVLTAGLEHTFTNFLLSNNTQNKIVLRRERKRAREAELIRQLKFNRAITNIFNEKITPPSERKREIEAFIANSILDHQQVTVNGINLCTILHRCAMFDVSLSPQALTKITEGIKSSPGDMKSQSIGNGLYGCGNLRSNEPEVRALIAAFVSKVTESRARLDCQELGNAIYGMRGFSGMCPEVQKLLEALTVKLSASLEPWRCQEVGNALYGLQRIQSSTAGFKPFLTALTARINTLWEPMDSQSVGNALYGLRSMSSDVEEVRSLVRVLSEKVGTCKVSLKPQEISNALYGLQGMNSDVPEVRELLSVLAKKFVNIDQSIPLESQVIGNALYGFQGFSNGEKEVQELLSVMSKQFAESKVPIRGIHAATGIYGLQLTNLDASHLPLVQRLIESLNQVAASKDRTTSDAFADLTSSNQVVSLILGCSTLPLKKSLEANKLIGAMKGLQGKLSKAFAEALKSKPVEPLSDEDQLLQKKYVEFVKRHFKEGHQKMQVKVKEFLHGFESDVVIYIDRGSGKPPAVVNIELDGSVHRVRYTKKRFCQLRDEYLRINHKITIERIGPNDRLMDAAVKDRLKAAITKASKE